MSKRSCVVVASLLSAVVAVVVFSAMGTMAMPRVQYVMSQLEVR